MKTLAQLIAELQAIPEPEKVVVITYSGDAQFMIEDETTIQTECKNLHFLDSWDVKKIKEAGFSRAICI